MRRKLAEMIVRLAAVVLPTRSRDWGRAMAEELAAIERPGAALSFALGCLTGALRHSLTSGFSANPPLEGTSLMPQPIESLRHPRRLAGLCAIGATGLGLAWMTAAGAPSSYLAINAAALAIGLLAVGASSEAGRLWRVPGGGGLAVGLASLLLLTALFGVSADGATRWVSIGGTALQPALILIPVVALTFARARDSASLAAVLIAAVALALQPDRAMAGALAAGMAALALARPERQVLVALGASLAAFAVTLARPDSSPAVPFVDQVYFSAFAIHPLAGLAVVGGAALMLVPAITGFVLHHPHRATFAVFGAVWLGVILAAALGNYPTPLVGYGGSAILGYLISLIGLPPGRAVPTEAGTRKPEAGHRPPSLRERLSIPG
jgi:hypothetical protein